MRGGMRNYRPDEPTNGKLRMKKTAILSRLLPYLLQNKAALFFCIVLTIGSNLLGLVGPYVSGLAIDSMELGKGKVNLGSVWYYGLIMIALYAVSAGLGYLLSRLMIYISRRVVNTMRRDVFNKLTELPVGYFDTNHRKRCVVHDALDFSGACSHLCCYSSADLYHDEENHRLYPSAFP